jgi:hypothetical protein
MLLGYIDTATGMCCYCNEISVNEAMMLTRAGRPGGGRFKAPHVNPFDEVDRCLGSKPKFVEQCRIQPNF